LKAVIDFLEALLYKFVTWVAVYCGYKVTQCYTISICYTAAVTSICLHHLLNASYYLPVGQWLFYTVVSNSCLWCV